MTETLFKLTLALAEEIEKGGIHEGSVVSDDTDTTLGDNTIALQDGVLDGGTLWVRTGARTGQTRVISSQVADVLTWSPAFTGAIGLGSRYTALGPEFPRHLLRRVVNRVLRNLPPYARYDTDLVTVANQEEYDLPTGVDNPKTVEIARLQTGPNLLYMTHTGWIPISYIDGADPTTDPTPAIRFWKNAPSVSGYTIRIGFNTIHRELLEDSDQINGGVSPNRLVFEAPAEARRSRIRPR